LRNVPPDIDQLIGYVPGARADGSVQEAWDAIKKPLRAYGSQGSMNALRQAWDDFAQCLRQTSDDPLEAWRQIAAGTKSGQAVPSFRALTAISSLVAGNLDLEQEYVANQLVSWRARRSVCSPAR